MKDFKYLELTTIEKQIFPGNAINWKYREIKEVGKNNYLKIDDYKSNKVKIKTPHKFIIKDV